MGNSFGKDILIQVPDPAKAAAFYVEQLGFAITDPNPKMVALHGNNIPTAVVENLIETTKQGVQPLQRYHRLRKRVLGDG